MDAANWAATALLAVPAPFASADLVAETVDEICLVAAPCCVAREVEVCDWTCDSALWPEETP
jgi:hypothetical protein